MKMLFRDTERRLIAATMFWNSNWKSRGAKVSFRAGFRRLISITSLGSDSISLPVCLWTTIHVSPDGCF